MASFISSGFHTNTQLLDQSGSLVSASDAFAGCDAVGVYFSAHWCPPCRGFTPILSERYRALKDAGKKVEIVFVSSDKDEESFRAYHSEMPFLAVPYAERQLKSLLNDKYSVSGIPSLIFFDPKGGQLLTSDGRKEISDSMFLQNFPYRPFAPPPKETWSSPDFPQRVALEFGNASMVGLNKAVVESSSRSLSSSDQETLLSLLDVLSDPTRYHGAKVDENAVSLVISAATGLLDVIPAEEIFPYVDLLRACTLVNDFLNKLHDEPLDDILLRLADCASRDDVKPVHAALFLQVVANLLARRSKVIVRRICLFVCLFVCLFACLFACLFVCLLW